ncbi:iron ABC transporter permease [Actinokineospora auranticolor]|uniref:Thiamine transport system permease protein n=1 Tax=Actinokineospora auranticolor TaxID=155976 RepID=A0A2S6GY90_9PSEU|nr:iron ABC transporter permease [Actinokineospora auranticolor]PPK70193.1 thiamine transport system permease protein [Actinokineospora auranticolor]
MARGRPRLAGPLAAAALPLGFLAVFFLWPVAAIIRLGIGPGVTRALTAGRTWDLVAFTLGQAAAATAIALVAGLPVAFLLARTSVRGNGFVRAVVMVPFVLPTVVVGLAFRALLPSAGVLAIVLANAFFNVAVVARTVAGLWSHVDRRAEDAARALGASRVRTFLAVTLPALRPAIGSAAAVVFLFCATSFGVVLMLGGGEYGTLETEIYLRTVQLFDLPGAAALSLLQVVAVVAVLVAGALVRRRSTALRLRGRADTARRPSGGEWVVVAAAYAVVAALLVPVATLVARSFESGLDGYRALAGRGYRGSLDVTGWQAVVNSLRAATDATLIALVLGTLACVALVSLGRARIRPGIVESVDTALMLPLGVSAVTVGFGYLVTLDALPGDLRTSAALVPLAQALVVTPLVIRMLLPVLRSIDDRLRQAAATLGASPWRVWREVDVPLAARSFLGATAFGYVVALGEFGATSFLARPDSATLPVVIGRLVGRPGELNNQMAYAGCALLMLVTIAAVVIVDRLRVGSVGEF